MSGPTAMLLDGGRRLHLQHGPIDLVIGAEGHTLEDKRQAFTAARARFETVLQELVEELPNLRKHRPRTMFKGETAGRMGRAIKPHTQIGFVSPMVAVAGAVADTVLAAMRASVTLRRAYVNNGGDIALHLDKGEEFSVAVTDLENQPVGRIAIRGDHKVGGLATSGMGGRSFSFGIATSVTVLATDAATADAAATLIANAVDIPDHSGIVRKPANEIDPNSDLGGRLVVTNCGFLHQVEIAEALQNGGSFADRLVADGTIESVLLHLRGQSRIVGRNHFGLTADAVRPELMKDAVYA